ncbi:hypothetical protein GQ55_8G034300 [Panicum hallii var. hallii]|uniref:Uncharacterized protein n=1 Tax=Panicum hallii var. hallii TaxID=1504633 RepID=A0A2T7CKJ6_9POAL|nr:hypothetical protein GQ55_8G034300 [Panicum hallii var. hallii]
MVTAVVESPLRQRQRLRSPLAGSGGGGDFEFRHRRTVKRVSGMRRRWAPPEIEIPNGHGLAGGVGGRGSYTSLRDIMSSPEYAKDSSPDEPGGSCGDVHMIRHPLVKHAAYAYLQLTPSALEEKERARLRRRRGPLCRLLVSCLGFLGALFRR